MSVVAQIKDGKIVESESAASLAQEKLKKKSTMDKDAFLGLLVAQMKYQDPLEPTSNTEFVAQYAQFSSLEQMQNMASTMELTRASSMVGKVVVVNTTDSVGRETQIEGRVDFVAYENGKSYVSIDGGLYSLDDIYAVEDQTYLDAVELVNQLTLAIDKLPIMDNFTLENASTVTALAQIYDQMSAYEKGFVPQEYVDKLTAYVERVSELQADKDKNNAGGGNTNGNTGGNTGGNTTV